LVPAISWRLIGFIWIYNLAWLVVLDVVKVALYREFDLQSARQSPWQKWFHTPLDAFGGRHGKLPKTGSQRMNRILGRAP
jgi:hypothetical protein